MNISLNWLYRHLPTLLATAHEIAEVLPSLGFEVASVQQWIAPELESVVVGVILESNKHPNADRLSVCSIDVGDGSIRSIVCGAKNYAVGDHVLVALPGANLPGGIAIKETSLRGVHSQGMLCSSQELGLPEKTDGILILTHKPRLGTPVKKLYVPSDWLLEIEITPNRGDCLSHLGIARELAAYYNLPMAATEWKSRVPAVSSNYLPVELASDACPLYTAWVIEGIQPTASPVWLKGALQNAGIRSINLIVDVTNWVMLDCGQPLHAFDADRVSDTGLHVRLAHLGETLKTLDGTVSKLDSNILIVADATGPLAIAGVMGGLTSGITDTTTRIIIESAYFHPAYIRKSSKQLNIHSDSAYRFMRSVDPMEVQAAALKAIELIVELTSAKLVGYTHSGTRPAVQAPIKISSAYISARIGCTCTDKLVENILNRLHFKTNRLSDGNFLATVPSFRSDVHRPIDLVEEFLRLHGTHALPKSAVKTHGLIQPKASSTLFFEAVANNLAQKGFQECYHYTLVDGSTIARVYTEAQAQLLRLENPLTSQHTHIRPTLIPGLLQTLLHNQAHHIPARNLFEVGTVFRVQETAVYECQSIAFVISTASKERHWKAQTETVDFFTIKALLLEFIQGLSNTGHDLVWTPTTGGLWQPDYGGVSGNLIAKTFEVAGGLIHLDYAQSLGIKDALFAGELICLPECFRVQTIFEGFEPFSLHPTTTKDLALIVDQAVPAETVRSKLHAIALKCLQNQFELVNLQCFDVHVGGSLPEGTKSLAFECVFGSDQRTLTDSEVMRVFAAIQLTLKAETPFILRTES